MRSSVLALLASSLLVKDVVSMPFFKNHKRDLYLVQENIIVTEVATVTAIADGSFKTGLPAPVGTTTVQAPPVLMSNAIVPTSVPLESSPAALPTTTAKEVESASQPLPSTTSSSVVAVSEPVSTSTPVAVVSTPAAVKTSTTSAAAEATSTTATSTTSNKRGLAFNYESPSLTNFLTSDSKIGWSYNWGSNPVAAPSSTAPSSLEYIPMLWGLQSTYTEGWAAAASSAIASGSKHLLGFNEPDLAAQSDLSVSAAVAGWKTYMEPFAGKALLGSPAVTNGGSPGGLTYLSNFISECTDCQIDFVCIHWYNGGDAQAFIDYISTAYAAGGNRPVWVTEFAAPGTSDADDQAFLNVVMPFMDSSDMVGGYAYFGAFDGVLLSSGNALSAVGDTFAFGS